MVASKVFCLGFQKTGTTSMAVFFESMGLRVAGYNNFREMEKGDISRERVLEHAIHIMKDHDCAQDTPWYVLYKELDATFPNSKFIHVVRDTESWIKSATSHFEHYPKNFHTWIYGCPYPRGHEQTWIDTYEQHNSDVKDYFSGRPDDYLFLRLDEVVGRSKEIARFIGYEGPVPEWPHANKNAENTNKGFLQRFGLRRLVRRSR
ncbi:MAG: sulfotransferase [Pseudomonadota bacterium]